MAKEEAETYEHISKLLRLIRRAASDDGSEEADYASMYVATVAVMRLMAYVEA